MIARKLQPTFSTLYVLNAEFLMIGRVEIAPKALRECLAEDEFRFNIVDSRR